MKMKEIQTELRDQLDSVYNVMEMQHDDQSGEWNQWFFIKIAGVFT